jgi:hypothetical protein
MPFHFGDSQGKTAVGKLSSLESVHAKGLSHRSLIHHIGIRQKPPNVVAIFILSGTEAFVFKTSPAETDLRCRSKRRHATQQTLLSESEHVVQ